MPVEDGFLRAHLFNHFVFEIGGWHSPFSIRDQMFRARTIVERARRLGLISPSGRRLLIVGAGAAGVTAALQAAVFCSEPIETVLVEGASEPFSRQSECPTRYICPTESDWPLAHWRERRYPWNGPAMPLSWRAGAADKLAHKWSAQLIAATRQKQTGSALTFIPDFPLRPRPDGIIYKYLPNGLHEVQFKDGTKDAFGMILFCTGPGIEITTLGNFQGLDFWEKDTLLKPGFGLRLPKKASRHNPRFPKTLISGGGDGALQDFVRAVTKRRSVGQVAAEIFATLDPLLVRQLEQRIFSVEDQFQRAFILSPDGEEDCRINTAIHMAHKQIIADLKRNNGKYQKRWPGVWEEISAFVQKEIISQPDATHAELIHPCTHFTKCYALNRFIVLLLASHIAELHHFGAIKTGYVVTNISGQGHICERKPRACFDRPHKVEMGLANCAEFRAWQKSLAKGSAVDTPQTIDSHVYHLITLRHGIKSTPIDGNPRAPVRHLLPYWPVS